MTAEDFDTELNVVVGRLVSGRKAVQSIYEREVTELIDRAEGAIPVHLVAASINAAQERVNKEMGIR